MAEGTQVEEEVEWRALDRGGWVQMLRTLGSFALVAALAFIAGFLSGGHQDNIRKGSVTVSPATSVAVQKESSSSCASLPDTAWKAQLCPSPHPLARRARSIDPLPKRLSPSCASLPDPAWKAQLCPSIYPANRAWLEE